ncbi:7575_t:CDS:2, partial [Racocetra persica]
KYLAENAEHFIDTIGKTIWVSYFNEKLLPEKAYKTNQAVSQEKLAEIVQNKEEEATAKMKLKKSNI